MLSTPIATSLRVLVSRVFVLTYNVTVSLPKSYDSFSSKRFKNICLISSVWIALC